jgi:hypothetical protein
MGHNYLKGRSGDRINALFAAIGYTSTSSSGGSPLSFGPCSWLATSKLNTKSPPVFTSRRFFKVNHARFCHPRPGLITAAPLSQD